MRMTERAVDKAVALRNDSGAPHHVLRLSVQPGGCAGLRYALVFDDVVNDSDDVQEELATDGSSLRVVVDRASTPYIEDATLDYVESVERMGFVFDNPAAAGGCACGDSFSC